MGEVAVEGFISFLNDDNSISEGYYDIIEYNLSYVKIRTKAGILIIPFHRVQKLKLKEDIAK